MTTTEDFVKLKIESLQNSEKTFAEFICEVFKDKFIEIYTGDVYEEIKMEQVVTSYPAVFCGKVVGAYKDCLVISCVYATGSHKSKKLVLGNLVFINQKSIMALNEVDGKAVMSQMFLKSNDTLIINSEFVKHD